MPNADFMQAASDWAHTALVWIGFGTLAGIVAKLVMPGRDPGGPIATLMMGIAGTCLGLGLLSYFTSQRITPISPLGFVIATGGAGLLLFFHRLLGGYFFTEQGEGYGVGRYGGYGYRRPYRRHRVPMVYD
ncbi:MAG TPA: GlsB/YeaQ/YmgE family stress response membrane protein [Pirellulales bacterium]